MSDTKLCAKCGETPARPGGILCPGCLAILTVQHRNFWRDNAHLAPNVPVPTPPQHERGER